MFLNCWFQWCWLACRRYRFRLLDLIHHVFATSGRVKKGPFCATVVAEVRTNFFFAQETVFFLAYVIPTSYQRPLGNSSLLELILFYFIFSIHNRFLGGGIPWQTTPTIGIIVPFMFNSFVIIIIIIILFLVNFPYERLLVVFHWSLSGNKSPRDSRTHLSILADYNNAVVWMVPILPIISIFSSNFFPSPRGTIHIITTALLSSHVLRILLLVQVYIYLFAFFYFHFDETAKFTRWPVFSYELRLCLIFWSGLDDAFVSRNPWEFHASHSLEQILFCVHAIR